MRRDLTANYRIIGKFGATCAAYLIYSYRRRSCRNPIRRQSYIEYKDTNILIHTQNNVKVISVKVSR